MEKFLLNDEIHIMYVTATSFPEGIAHSFDILRSILPDNPKRRYFGLSRPEGGQIVYKAAGEQLFSNEDKELNLPDMFIKAGTYAAIIVENYTQNPQSISEAFQEILAQGHLDPQGYCIECYLNAWQVRCMVRLAQ